MWQWQLYGMQDLAEHEVDRGVRIFRIHSLGQRTPWLYRETERRHAPPWPDPAATWALRRVIDQVQPDVVHAHNWLMYSYLPLKWSSRPGTGGDASRL